MPLKILLADDSMTAQNMGKKILSEGGYEVVVVSNGSAALKKIAEHKPDIVVLDIYMPGYSGLEVCERLKSTMESAKVPVLLSVGKLEPFRPEDAVRVRAEGVIIKPFEATELLAVVERAAGHIVKRAPVPEATAYEQEPESYPEEIAESNDGVFANAEVEIPDEVASAPVFGIDESVSSFSMDSFDSMHADPRPSFTETGLESFSVAGPEEHIVAVSGLDNAAESETGSALAEPAVGADIPATEAPAESDLRFDGAEKISGDEPRTSEVPDEVEQVGESTSAANLDPLLYKPYDGGPISSNLEPEMFVDNPDPGAVIVNRDPNLFLNDTIAHVEMLPEVEVTAQDTPEPVDAPVDPALIARENLMSEIDKFPPLDPDDDLVCEGDAACEGFAEQAEPMAGPQEQEEPVEAEDDFEALVSAAMAKFDPEPVSASAEGQQHPEAVAATSWRAEQAALDQSERALSLEHEMQIALAVASGASSVAVRQVAGIGDGSSNGNGSGAAYSVGAATEEAEPATKPELDCTEARTHAVRDDEPTVPNFFSAPSTEPQKAIAEVEAEPKPTEPSEQKEQEGTPLPALAASTAAGVLTGTFTQGKDSLEQERLVEAIGRVLERLKPQIVSELVKELKDEK